MGVINNEYNFKVYMHINKSNNKKYIGITSQKPQNRWGNKGIKYIKGNQYFGNAIKKYGWDNFEHIIIGKGLTKEEAEYFEILLIKIWKSNNRQYGYNISDGGFYIPYDNKEVIHKMKMYRIKNKDKIKRNLDRIRPLTKEWHGSKEGIDWHKKHYEKMKDKLYEKKSFVCKCCGKDFMSVKEGFCSNKCKSKYRRDMGFDNIEKECIVCGTNFISNKYHNSNTCSKSCGIKLGHIKKKKITCDDIIYNSIEDFAKNYKVNWTDTCKWLNNINPMPLKYIELNLKFLDNYIIPQNNRAKRRVICEGVIYESIAECSRHYGINSSKMNQWLNGKTNMRKDFYDKGLNFVGNNTTIYPQNKGSGCKIQVICDDIIFNSIRECEKYYNLSKNMMSPWLRGDKSMPQKFVDLNLRYYDDDMKTKKVELKWKKVICDNKVYDTITECAKAYSVNQQNMWHWLEKKRLPQVFMDIGLRYLDDDISIYEIQTNYGRSKKILCDDKIFISIKKCADFYNINLSTLKNWLYDKSPMPNKYIDLGLRYATEEDLNTYELY